MVQNFLQWRQVKEGMSRVLEAEVWSQLPFQTMLPGMRVVEGACENPFCIQGV